MEVHHKKDEVGTVWKKQEMPPQDQTECMDLAGRLNLLAVDPPDLLLAAKDCGRIMGKPLNMDWEPIKRVCPYLIVRPRIVHAYWWQDEPDMAYVYSVRLGRLPGDEEVCLRQESATTMSRRTCNMYSAASRISTTTTLTHAT